MRRFTTLGIAMILTATTGCRPPAQAPDAAAGRAGRLAAHGGLEAHGAGPMGEASGRAMAAPLNTGLRRIVTGYLADRPGHAGLSVQDLRTGASFGYQDYGRFITASVAKVNILTALLLERQAEHRELTGGERVLAAQMIRNSDNTAADTLYAAAGQGSAVTKIDRGLGLAHTEPYPAVWGATRTCPADQVKLLHVLTDPASPLTPAHQRYVLGLMGSVSADQAWGVSAAADKGESVALKNGWTPSHFQGSGWAVNSIGRITGPDHDFLVAVFTADQPDMKTGIRTAERLAQLAVSGLRHTP